MKKQPSRVGVDKKSKSVSTSAIFKKTKVDATKKTTSKTQARSSKDSNEFKKYRIKRISEHPLATAFSRSLSNSRERIKQQASTSLTSICQSVSTRAIKVEEQFDEQLQTVSKSDARFLQPLENEQLQFKSHDGTSSGIVKLSDRMAVFRKLVASEEQALESLRNEWLDVQNEIATVATETLGAKGLEELMNGKMDGNFATKEQNEWDEDLERMRAKFLEEVQTMSEQAIEGMREGEKELKIREIKQRKRLFDLFTVDD